jgi:hypothetical protein
MSRKLNIIITALILLFIISCGVFDRPHPCQQIINKETMATIVTEAFLLESYLSSHKSSMIVRDSVPYYYAAIFQKHGVTHKEFDEALRCYLLDRDQMNWLLDDVLSILSIEQSRTE